MAKAFIYKGANGNTIFFAASYKRARYIAFKELAGDESFNDMVVQTYRELDYMDRPDSYVLDIDNPSDRIELQKAGILN